MKVAVTGAGGQLGHEFCRQLGPRAIPLLRPNFDLRCRLSVLYRLRSIQPDVIINCAAFTDVDRAEREPNDCFAVNAAGVGVLAEYCRSGGATLVQISTDYVFGADQTRRTPYYETDEPGPQGVYARAKLAGERQAATCEKHIVARTCGLYGDSPCRNNFVDKVLRLARQRDRLQVVADQHCTPSYIPHVAAAVLFLLDAGHCGIYHVVNSGTTTWFKFAQTICQLAGVEVAVEPISTERFSAPARRPQYSVLDIAKYLALGGPPLATWREALGMCVSD